tara:strand:+ start:14013 stop:15080 length:1068 start_codon:yes stop_codon:yes gene_type:complete
MPDNYKQIINSFLNDINLYPEKNKKKKKFLQCMMNLDKHHYKFCDDYKKILKASKFQINIKKNIEEEFYLPVNLFKKFQLISIKKKKIANKLQSSGTTGNASRIFLDVESSIINNRILQKLLKNNLENFNVPIIFFDHVPENLDKKFDARKAAIKGFSIISNEKYFVMKKNGTLDLNKLNKILKSLNGGKAYIFGFTSILWSLFNENLEDIRGDLSNITVIHGGGWKKMQSKKISIENFNYFFKKNFKINKIKNYYGMVEQIGSIFFNCDFNYFHTHSFSDIIIRDNQLKSLPFKKKGLIQLVSLLPRSYPGHSILTEDLGTVFGEDDCKCGKPGKYFKIWGRLPKSEIRGCSDV